MDPALQYGPNSAGGFGPFTIALVVFSFLISSWLFGAVYTFISRGNNSLSMNNRESDDQNQQETK